MSSRGPRAEGATTTAPPSSLVAGTVARIQQICVVHTVEPRRDSPVRVAIDGAELVIGRQPQGPRTLAVSDARLSRSHAAIQRDSTTGDAGIFDCGSSHGTFVGGVRVERAPLTHGSVIRLGATVLVFVDTQITLEEGKSLAPETPGLLGHSLAMQRVRGEIALVAPRALPVLVLGETGTGKERVAEEIHRQSGRLGPFIALNCAAIPSALAETELFGHAAGAFTGATQKSDGVLVAADRGTLFLDEIAELPPAVQPKLLRALATGEVRAVGKADARWVNVRLIAATHADLPAAVDGGGFRGDLLARLAGWTLRVPPLRHRRDDVLHLARSFLARHPGSLQMSASCAEALALYDWPFNVRELEHALAAAAVRATEGIVRPEHLSEPIARPVLSRARLSAGPREAAETPLAVLVPPDTVPDVDGLRLVAERFHGNVALVARYFGKDRKQVYRWAEKLGVDLDAWRDPR